MALKVRIDLEECYKIEDINEDLSSCSFKSVLDDDSIATLAVQIDGSQHPLMPDVYNLAFGPLNDEGEINDMAELKHKDYSRVFSTIVLAAMTFLTEHASKFLGIDGSSNSRAYLYYRCIRNNFEYLSQFFRIYGIKYYVRKLRKVDDEDEEYPIDFEDEIPVPTLIENPGHIPHDKLYNYFIFRKINSN